ncbi:MAG TPA: aminotransferase class IV, partial [Chitinophagaceae bacterium]|nr:aminotransferase class IV [Chitinophagaceae bacterium]
MIAFFNTAFYEENELSLKVTDLSIQRGFAVFDFFRTKDFIPLFLSDYLERFYNSISLMQLEPPCSEKELTNIIHELISKNNIPESGIKLLLTGGYSADGYTPAKPNLVITQQPVTLTTPEKFAEGIRIITWDYQRELPEVKSINYLMGVWLQRKVNEKQAADVLYHKNGIITEFPRSNVFVVTADQAVITPAENILPGITRKKVLELAG